jgi:hypothetical protein
VRTIARLIERCGIRVHRATAMACLRT